MHLVQLTGKSRYPIHPKHLIKIERSWYLGKIKPTDKVLDLGCNNGQHTLKIAKKCRKIIGLDQDERQLTIAVNSASERGIKNVIFRKQNLEKKLNFSDRLFDKVIFLDVLEHLVNRRQILLEIKRVLKPRGLVFIAIPNSQTSWKKLQRRAGINSFADPDHKIEYTAAAAKKQLTDLGFKILSFQPVTFDSPWVGFFDLLGGISLTIYSRIARFKRLKAQKYPQESTGFRIIAEAN
jgi:2-polyprenyl-3-methyl-5-hydroxy-6-metoxy-1,4-benzoquinol methylase